MLGRILLTSALGSLAIAGTATAAQAPTLGPMTIINAGQQEGPRVSFGVSTGSHYHHRSIKVHFNPRPGADANGAQASVYALCKTS